MVIMTFTKKHITKKHITKKHISKKLINEKIISILEVVKNYYSRIKDTNRVNSYERAIYQIKKWPSPIKQGKELSHLEGIGKGMIEKIDTIIKTGTLPIIQEQKLISNGDAISGDAISGDAISGDAIKDILGFGEKYAMELKNKYGITNIHQLQNLFNKGNITLTHTQEIGLLHHNDLQHLIPRKEITAYGNLIKSILADGKLYGKLYVFLAGSYPSGQKKESKDIDILIISQNQHNKTTTNTTLQSIINKLNTANKIDIETISLGDTKFLGLIRSYSSNRIWRHLDIRLVNIASFPYAWLHYTGGKVFNKLIREKLKKKGYKLNEWGLYTIKGGNKVILEGEQNDNELWNSNMTEKELLEYSTNIEKQIFILANLEYKTITERY